MAGRTSLVAAVLMLLVLAGCGGGTSSASGQAARGKALAERRCRYCHSTNGSKGVGPTWKGLAGSRVKLADGTAVTAGDAYLRTAIEDPDRQVVAGFRPGIMSGTIAPRSISPDDARALIAYIKTLR